MVQFQRYHYSILFYFWCPFLEMTWPNTSTFFLITWLDRFFLESVTLKDKIKTIFSFNDKDFLTGHLYIGTSVICSLVQRTGFLSNNNYFDKFLLINFLKMQ